LIDSLSVTIVLVLLLVLLLELVLGSSSLQRIEDEFE
jgi:hypothetical protein